VAAKKKKIIERHGTSRVQRKGSRSATPKKRSKSFLNECQEGSKVADLERRQKEVRFSESCRLLKVVKKRVGGGKGSVGTVATSRRLGKRY